MKRSTNLLLIKISIAFLFFIIPPALIAYGMNYYENRCMENVVKRIITEIYAIQQENSKSVSSSASNEASSEESECAFP